MKDLITDAIQKKLSATLEAVGGVRALYGDPITFNGEQIVPVARIVVSLSAGAEGSGGGNAGIGGALGGFGKAGGNNAAKGGGGGNAEAGIRVAIEPAGFLRSTPQGPQFVPLQG
jgi:hypothetical protein